MGEATASPADVDKVPPRVVYSLSDIGNSLHPIISAMADWGNDYKTQIV